MSSSVDLLNNKEERIRLFESLLREQLIPSHICQDLVVLIGRDEVQKIRKMERKSTGDAVSKLLDILIKQKKQGWFTAFIDALKNNEYEMIASHLIGEREMKNTKVFQKLIDIFCKQITDIVDPADILTSLLERSTITRQDYDDIQMEIKNTGKRSGMLCLICRLPLHNNYWLADFIEVLISTKIKAYEDLAELIEPRLKKEYEADIRVSADEVLKLNQMFDPKRGERQQNQQTTDTTNDGTIHEYYEYQEQTEDSINLDAGIREHSMMSRLDPEGEEMKSMGCEDELFSMTGTLDCVSRQHSTEVSDEYQLTALDSTDHENTMIKNCMVDRDNSTLQQHTLDYVNNLSVTDSPKKVVENKEINISSDWDTNCEDARDDLPWQSQAGGIENQSEADGSRDNKTDDISEPLDLRSYQRELAGPALDGKQVIIVAPTGSGKTHVAMYITKNHLESGDGNKKVVFLVPTTELVEQQTNMYKRYLHQFRTCPISGEVQVSQKVTLSRLLNEFDIMVMTPQILVDALEMKDVTSLSVFTLMIFDECHHATKNHPYNNIMATYIEEKYSEDRTYLLPQIIGLTASVGVGNARDVPGAVKHILSLCANLNTINGISTVQKNKEEIEKFVNRPKEEKRVTHGRREDPFRSMISGIMKTVEDHMIESLTKQNINTLSRLVDVPGERGCDQYTQWISQLHKEVAKIYQQSIRRPVYSCQAHLRIYNAALMINEDCRTVDALDYLQKEFKEIDSEHKDDTDRWLDKLFSNHRDELKRVSSDPRCQNPKLTELGKLLLDKYKQNPDMRAIIFCKTRALTMALQKWITETPELVIFKPNHLVGANASAEKGGMTQRKQEDVLKYFKDGKHKVIIATSVAEEGLDVSKCNLVIRYEYVTNEIAMVQARGRGRAEDSEYVVMGDQRRGAAQKEEINKIRENMMNKAIEQVKDMTDESRTNEIIQLQEEARSIRKMSEVGKEMKAASRPKDDLEYWELRCVKCDAFGCLASDIRVFKQSYHMVLDVSFREHIIVEPHPNPKMIGDVMKTDKIYCRKCRQDWGVQVTYKATKMCVIKVVSFISVNMVKKYRNNCRKWKEAPFTVSDLTQQELEQYANSLMEAYN